jgi:AraC-like DNA-binding protein
MPSLDKRDESIDWPGVLPRGFLDRRRIGEVVSVRRYRPAPEIAHIIDNHFVLEWNLPSGRSETQRLLPSPQANLIIGPNSASVFGVHTGLRVDALHGAGRVVGSRFRVGGLRPYLDGPLMALTGSSMGPELVTGFEEGELIAALASEQGDQGLVGALTEILAAVVPPPDPKIELVEAMVGAMRQTGGPVRVEAIAEQFSVTLRQVQRLFHDYVGVPPKWVIRRYRLQETALRLASAREGDIAAVAAALGYFDQAHLARDFRALFGCSPNQYRTAHEQTEARPDKITTAFRTQTS